jgi:hypothetical protein
MLRTIEEQRLSKELDFTNDTFFTLKQDAHIACLKSEDLRSPLKLNADPAHLKTRSITRMKTIVYYFIYLSHRKNPYY